VVVQLVGGHVDSTVNNPIEAVAQWRAGKLRPLCVFSAQRMQYGAKVTETAAWSDIPTCHEQGLAVEYQMLRGIFMPPGVSAEQVAYYTGVLAKVRETPEWKEFLEKGAFNPTALGGAEFSEWVAREETRHRELMAEAGFLAGAAPLEPVGAPRTQP
jgi:tripartite-type tricarboxylate transporter receptor subunit TctC